MIENIYREREKGWYVLMWDPRPEAVVDKQLPNLEACDISVIISMMKKCNFDECLKRRWHQYISRCEIKKLLLNLHQFQWSIIDYVNVSMN